MSMSEEFNLEIWILKLFINLLHSSLSLSLMCQVYSMMSILMIMQERHYSPWVSRMVPRYKSGWRMRRTSMVGIPLLFSLSKSKFLVEKRCGLGGCVESELTLSPSHHKAPRPPPHPS